jgi:hypothetical protein
VATMLALQGCSTGPAGGREEGIIEFDTKPVDLNHPLSGFAPNSATLKFKGNRFIIEMSTMGMFNMAIIGDNKTRTMAQTVKFMNIRQASLENEAELRAENAAYPLKLEETGEDKEILGLKCYRVRATRLDQPNQHFDVWYTKDLGMENANALTPYAPLKGVLIDYRIKKFDMEMHFKAKSYKSQQVPDNNFEIPASMKIVSREEMAQFFKDLQ